MIQPLVNTGLIILLVVVIDILIRISASYTYQKLLKNTQTIINNIDEIKQKYQKHYRLSNEISSFLSLVPIDPILNLVNGTVKEDAQFHLEQIALILEEINNLKKEI